MRGRPERWLNRPSRRPPRRSRRGDGAPPVSPDDTLYGRIKNRVLTLSGNNSSIRVDGGSLIVSDGPVAVPANHRGPALPVKERMVTCRFRRADCPIDRIV